MLEDDGQDSWSSQEVTCFLKCFLYIFLLTRIWLVGLISHYNQDNIAGRTEGDFTGHLTLPSSMRFMSSSDENYFKIEVFTKIV